MRLLVVMSGVVVGISGCFGAPLVSYAPAGNETAGLPDTVQDAAPWVLNGTKGITPSEVLNTTKKDIPLPKVPNGTDKDKNQDKDPSDGGGGGDDEEDEEDPGGGSGGGDDGAGFLPEDTGGAASADDTTEVVQESVEGTASDGGGLLEETSNDTTDAVGEAVQDSGLPPAPL